MSICPLRDEVVGRTVASLRPTCDMDCPDEVLPSDSKLAVAIGSLNGLTAWKGAEWPVRLESQWLVALLPPATLPLVGENISRTVSDRARV